MFDIISGIVLRVSNTTDAEFWQVEFFQMKPLFTGINAPGSVGFGAEQDAMISIELIITETGSRHKMNPITDFLHVVILNDEQEVFARFSQDNPVSTKQYLAPIGAWDNPEKVVIEDVLPRLDQYYIWFVNRREILYQVDGQIVIKNSFGHLDVDARYFPIYCQVGFFWHLTVLLIWCTLLWMKREDVVTVHILVGGYIFVRVVEKLLSWMYAAKLNRTGEPDSAEAVSISTLQDMLDVLGLLSMLMFASGYQIREQVNQRKVRLFIWTAFCYVITCIAQSFCYMSPNLCNLISLMRFIFRACLLLGVIWLINASSSIIQSELHQELFVETTKLRYFELAMLKAVRAGFLTYVIAPIVLSGFMYSFLHLQDISMLVLLKDVLLMPFIEGYILYHMRPSNYMIPRNM